MRRQEILHSTSLRDAAKRCAMARIAVVGPGAIGGIMAAWLGRSGEHEVIVCSRRPLAEFTVETPKTTIVARPKIITSPAEAPAVDWVFVATKAYNAEATALWLKPLTSGGAPIAVLQNGVEHRERFAPYLPIQRIAPVLVYCPAERPEPTQHSLITKVDVVPTTIDHVHDARRKAQDAYAAMLMLTGSRAAESNTASS